MEHASKFISIANVAVGLVSSMVHFQPLSIRISLDKNVEIIPDPGPISTMNDG